MITFKVIDENSQDFVNGELYCNECSCENVHRLQERHNAESNSYTIICIEHSEEILF